MASPAELLEQIRLKSQQPNALGFTGGQLGMGAGQGVLPETPNPFAVQTGVTPQAPVVAPTLGNEQAAIPRMTPELAAQREAARGPMEDSSFFGNIGSVFGAPQESVVPRGGVRTRGTGGSVNPEAEARTGGIAGADELLGFTEAVQGIVNPSEEQKAANLAAGRTGGIQALPEPQVAAPQVEVSTPEAITGATQEQTATQQQAEANSPQANFNARMATGEPLTDEEINSANALAKSMGTTFNPETGYSRDAFEQFQATQQAPQQAGDFGLAGFTPQFEGQTPSQFMRGEDTPESTTFQGTDFQGRLRQFDSPEAQQANIAEGQASFAQASADREARQAARPDFGAALSDRDRQAMASGETVSKAPTAVFKEEAEANGLTGRAKSEYIAEKKRVWDEAQSDRATSQASAKAAAVREKLELGIKVTEAEQKLVESQDKIVKAKQAEFEESRNNVRSTQDSFEKLRPVAEEIAALSGTKFTEGVLGWGASVIPLATDANQIERLTTEFEGSAFLQGLIDAKAKGATFGALSEREGDRILGQWGKITAPNSTNEQRITAINSMLKSIQRASERAVSDHAEKFPDMAAKSSANATATPSAPREGQVTTSSGKTYTFK